jgi:hypothetical protein
VSTFTNFITIVITGGSLRKKLTLFYGGGRLRLPTFKIYAKIADARNREDQLTVLRRRLGYARTLISILETRADIFFFRIGFFKTIFEARYYCFLRRARSLELYLSRTTYHEL